MPTKSVEEDIDVAGTKYKIAREAFHQLLFGGDQMTAARCRGAQIIRINSTTDSLKLCGLHPVAEDWHAKVILLEVHVY